MHEHQVIFPVFTDRKGITGLTSIKETKIKKLRASGEWQEGIHYVYIHQGKHSASILYNVAICLNWIANRTNPERHEKTIVKYCKLLEQLEIGSLEAFCVDTQTIHQVIK